MLRLPTRRVTTLRLVPAPTTPATAWRAQPKRSLASESSPPSPQSRSSGISPGAWIGAVAILSGTTAYYVFSEPDSFTRGGREVPQLGPPASDGEVAWSSPVKVLDLASANAKLREQAVTYSFEGKDKERGRVDVVRLNSNHPVEDDWALSSAKGVGGSPTLFAGVYDGHAGWATSKVLRDALIPSVATALNKLTASSSQQAICTSIADAFSRLDDSIMGNAQKAVEAGHEPGAAEVLSALAPAIAGSCALLTAYDTQRSTLYTAVTGDSRAVLGSWASEAGRFEADPLSEDQTGFNEAEVERITKEHPGEKTADMIDAKTGRLLGIMVTRGFGDHRWKWPVDLLKKTEADFHGSGVRPRYKTPPYMTARPEVTTRKVKTDDFVILASDGLWDLISNDDAVACVDRWLKARGAGKAETAADAKAEYSMIEKWECTGWQATPDNFAIEDLDNAAVCLTKNALGGNRRGLFRGAMTAYSPMSRNMRDDITVQVIFFRDPPRGKSQV